MAFTNPILAGDQLVRSGIESDNYVPGVSGWRIARDGAAEFDNVGIRGDLWVPTIIYNGQEISSYWNRKAGGLVAWIRGYPTTSISGASGEAQIFATEAAVTSDRAYEVALDGVTPDIANPDQCEYHIHYLLNSSSAPTHANSPTMAMTLRLSQFRMGQCRAVYVPPNNGTLKITATICTLDGNQVRNWCPGDGGILSIRDIGPKVNQSGTVGTGAPVKILKEWTITANSSRTYLGDGTLRTDQYATSLVMGDWANGKGNQRAWWTFSNADDSTYLDDLINVAQADVLIAEVRLAPYQYWNNLTNSGYISLGFHNTKDSLPAGNEPSGGIPNVHRPTASGSGPQWFNINPNTGAPNNFLNSMRDGYLNGFMVGNTFGGGDYAIVCEGTGGWTNYPQLHMKYWKLT
jgi:hypothetical protein